MQAAPVMVRNSERATFKRCRQKWYWSYVKQADARATKGALTFGTMIHGALELWYPPGLKRGIHPAETFRKLWAKHGQAFDQWDDEDNRIKAEDLGIAMCEGYVERWAEDDKFIEIIAPEENFEIDVYRRGKYLCTVVGRFDALFRDLRTGRLRILEHKTAKSIKHVRINTGYGEQGLMYWWAATLWLRHKGVLGPKDYIDGITWNFLRKALPDSRPQNKRGHYLNKPSKAALAARCASEGLPDKGTVEALTARLELAGVNVGLLGEVSKLQPGPLFSRQGLPLEPEQLRMFERRLRREAREILLARDGRLDIYKNPTMDCDWDCPFVDVCELHEMGGDYQAVFEYDFKAWDPYEGHELVLEKD